MAIDEFAAHKRVADGAGTKRRLPLFEVFRRYPRNVALVALGCAAAFVIQSLLGTFALTLAVLRPDHLGQRRTGAARFLIGNSGVQSSMYGPMAAFIPEMQVGRGRPPSDGAVTHPAVARRCWVHRWSVSRVSCHGASDSAGQPSCRTAPESTSRSRVAHVRMSAAARALRIDRARRVGSSCPRVCVRIHHLPHSAAVFHVAAHAPRQSRDVEGSASVN